MNIGEEEKYNNFQKFDITNPDESNQRSSKKKEEKEELQTEKKKGCQFPSTYTILLIIEVIVFILTYIIPKGKFDTIEYSSNKFIIKSYNKPDLIENATQSILDKYKIRIPLENFEEGYIKKAISIPGTYQRIEENFTNPLKVCLYPISGLIESANISFFLMILGGITNILIEMKALSSGISALSRITKGKEFLLVCLVFILISVGGTIFGLSEEILAFYPILMPIFLKSGIDGVLATSSLYLGSIIGNMFSIVNAFTVVLASYSAGITFIEGIVFRIVNYVIADTLTILYLYYYYRKIKLDETKSICFDIKKDIEDKYLKDENEEKPDIEKANNEDNPLLSKPKEKKIEEFTCLQKVALLIFLSGFILIIPGVLAFEWWFEDMSALFFIISIILMFFLGKGESKGIEVFTKGTGDFSGVALIVGISRGINITLEDGKISDTILNALSGPVEGLHRIVFAILMFIIFIFLGFFIQSYTGLALLSMPVLAPLADNISCSRSVVVDAYLFGQNFIGLITPTGLILIILQMTGVKYNHWLKFMLPFMIVFFIYLMIIIILDSFL